MKTIVIVTFAFFITSAITNFDATLTNAVKTGELPPDQPLLPAWIGWLYWLHWGLIIALFVFNWKFALLVFIVRSVLSFFGILTIIGNILMAPLKWFRK